MLSWWSGSRNPAQNPPDAVDNTQLEPPETPAPVFAARAIKHAIFGTPAPPETVKPARVDPKPAENSALTRPLPPNFGLKNAVDPDKPRLPGGILSTPGTVKDRKTVSFGAHVVDNEGKRSAKTLKTGLPSNCPGKFPSPFTPKGDAFADDSEVSSSSKLTARLYEARDSSRRSDPKPQPPPHPVRPQPRARDDGDVTIDIMEPRSESGRYWKAELEGYITENEKHVKLFVGRLKAARDEAKQSDQEAREAHERLDAERKRHAMRERDLEAKNKEYKERLRLAMAENLKSSTEIAMLKQRLAVLEGRADPDVPGDQSLPKTELEREFDQMMLDPQEASRCTLDATPVNARGRFEKQRIDPRPSATEQKPLTKATLLPPSTEPQSRLAVSPRRPRRSTTGARAETARAHTKTASTSAVEDPWMATGDSAMAVRPRRSFSPAKKPDSKAPGASEGQNATHPRRVQSDRHLQALVNPAVATSTRSDENLTPEELRKKSARERVMQRKRERAMGKENAGVHIASLR